MRKIRRVVIAIVSMGVAMAVSCSGQYWAHIKYTLILANSPIAGHQSQLWVGAKLHNHCRLVMSCMVSRAEGKHRRGAGVSAVAEILGLLT